MRQPVLIVLTVQDVANRLWAPRASGFAMAALSDQRRGNAAPAEALGTHPEHALNRHLFLHIGNQPMPVPIKTERNLAADPLALTPEVRERGGGAFRDLITLEFREHGQHAKNHLTAG